MIFEKINSDELADKLASRINKKLNPMNVRLNDLQVVKEGELGELRRKLMAVQQELALAREETKRAREQAKKAEWEAERQKRKAENSERAAERWRRKAERLEEICRGSAESAAKPEQPIRGGGATGSAAESRSSRRGTKWADQGPAWRSAHPASKRNRPRQ